MTDQNISLKQKIRDKLRASAAGRRLLRLKRMLTFHMQSRGKSSKEIFTEHYEANWWGDPESRSGAGSNLAYTENIRREIPKLIADLGIRSILDAPCGDFYWFSHVKLPDGVSYIGGDIVPQMIAENQGKHGNRGRFIELDIVKDPLPSVDLWLCRMVLVHFSHHDVWAALDNFLRSGISYLLTTTHPKANDNGDIVTGLFHPINLERPPFNFCAPLRAIDDYVGNWEVCKLALWDRESLAKSLAANKDFRRFQQRN